PGLLRVSCHGGDGGITIVVEDNGQGIPPAVQANLALPFPEIGSAGKSLGIGLTVTLGIIAEMGGRVTFDNLTPGTRVTIHLPKATGHDGRSVLVVDDETEAAREIGDYLAGQGWHVRIAGSGNEAIRLFDQVPCDIVITDLHMPNGDGWQLIEGLHLRAPDLPIITITTAQGADARRAVAAGAVLVLNKPVGLEQIAQELGELIAEAS
ncbi:MAG: response regulator, partial [Magnetospirillum sp.]|nr:response regulator [Magnetospirillum sp.]